MARQRRYKNSLTVGRIGEYCLPIVVRGWIRKGKYPQFGYPAGITGLVSRISETSLSGITCQLRRDSLSPNLKRKEVISNGSSDLDGAFRTSRGSRPYPG